MAAPPETAPCCLFSSLACNLSSVSRLPNPFLIECHVSRGREIYTAEERPAEEQILSRGTQTDVRESSGRREDGSASSVMVDRCGREMNFNPSVASAQRSAVLGLMETPNIFIR